jgi:hypothetical protein
MAGAAKMSLGHSEPQCSASSLPRQALWEPCANERRSGPACEALFTRSAASWSAAARSRSRTSLP